jgi:hypothetical protein
MQQFIIWKPEIGKVIPHIVMIAVLPFHERLYIGMNLQEKHRPVRHGGIKKL